MTDAPPSRYQVVERGRRLVVIDRASGEEVSHAHPGGPPGEATPPVAFTLPEKVRFDGGSVLKTHPLYDDRAPRTITIDAASAATIQQLKIAAAIAAFVFVVLVVLEPFTLIALALLLQPGWRKVVRARITAWLDVRERENG